ncbi:AraC family transcriptional regulator [Paenibacillus sp. S3N08]|uniref:AraC family transcriptional regulator n=1 Tax=Paenibacillus agricola TaxID=2716264 RepID=A0ABX0J899_9BACL|nr:AraC family transcriptional regulator [Paenibacillus agricola]
MTLEASYTRTAAFFISYKDDIQEQREPVGHFHDSFELVYFSRADIQIFLKDKQYQIHDGDLLLINEFDIHRILYKPNSHYTRYVINFKHNFIRDLLVLLQLETTFNSLVQSQTHTISLDLKQRYKIEQLFKALYDMQEDSVEKIDLTLEPSIKMNLLLLLIEYYQLVQMKAYRKREDFDKEVQEIIHFIDTRFMEDIQLEDLEQLLGISKYTICRIFKKSTRFTFSEYLQHRRIIEAQKKLISSDKPIIEIGLECGFQNLQHFYRVFKKISNCTPSQYRKQKHHNGL